MEGKGYSIIEVTGQLQDWGEIQLRNNLLIAGALLLGLILLLRR